MNEMKSLPPHPRGYRFEVWLAELFSTFKLAPRSSFRNTGEQIDGSFRLNDDFYLVEAKWHQNRTPVADLHVFEGKLSTKAKWARGVFISWMGFTDEGLTAFGKGKRVICVSGYDLSHSLSYGIALPEQLEPNSVMQLKQGSLMLSSTGSTPLRIKYPARRNNLPGNTRNYP